MSELAWHIGAITIWFSIAHIITIGLICYFSGALARRMAVGTVPELLEKIFDLKSRALLSPVMTTMVFAITCLEVVGCGVLLSIMTGLDLRIAVVISGIIGVLYVALSGLWEVGFINAINVAILYVILVISTVALDAALPGGLLAVGEHYIKIGEPWMIDFWGKLDIFLGWAVGICIATTVFQGFSQMGLQPALAVKDLRTLRRSLLPAALLNGLIVTFYVVFGLAAKVFYPELGAKLGPVALILEKLPWPIATVLFAATYGAVLDTYAMTDISVTNMFVYDVYHRLINPEASEKFLLKLSRIMIIVFGFLAIIPALALPPMAPALYWLFSFGSPVFVSILFGLYWKRAPTAAFAVMAITWLINCIWSLTPIAEILKAPVWFHNVYVTLISSIILGIIFFGISKGPPGLLRTSKEVK